MKLAIGFKFRHGSRVFIITGISYKGGPKNGIADTLLFREVYQEPEPSHIIERDYNYMQNLLDKGVIIHL